MTIFRRFFCLTVPKKLVEEPFCVVFQNVSGSEKLKEKGGKKYLNFLSTFLFSPCQNI